MIILTLCTNACETGRYGGKQTGERRERAFWRCFIYSGRRKVKGERNRENEKHYEKIADGMSVCMVLSMTPATAMAAGSENVLSGSEASGIPGAKETVMGYKLAPGWEIMGEDASHYTAQGTDSVSIDVQYGDLYYANGSVRNTAKNVFLHTVDEADFAISAKLDFKPDQDFQSAGLIIYRDENANFAATRRYHSYFENKSLCIQGMDADSFTEGHMADPSQEQAPIWLRVVKEGTTLTSYYRLSEEDEWTEYDSREWSSFEGAEAGDLKVGFYTGNSKSNGSPAVFSDFSIQYGSEAPQETAVFEETEIEAPDERIEYITDRDWYSAEVGYGSPKKDTGVDGDAIVLGGRTYSRGLAAHADSRVVYDIEGLGVLRFQAVAGVNKPQGSCQFIVEADGKELVKTDILHGTDETQAIDVEIPEGTKMLTLITNTGEDNGNYDHSIWADAKFVMDPAEREKRFAQWEEWGIAGIKPDFFNSSSQEYMQLYQDLIEETAEHHLLLNLHGLPKPAGERRTYPHLLTREAVFGHEQELFRPSDVSAFHNCMLPFMRNAVGPADYTPMFSYRNSNGQVRFSLAQMAAMPVVYESGIQCLADRSEEYIGSPAEFYFKSFPAAWDESHVLQAVPGDLVTIARRSGEDWYVGSMCNTQHDAVIDLSFLGDGEYYAVICKDGETQEEIVGEMQVVTKEDTLTIPMLETGGAALKILKEKPSEPDSITIDQTSLTLEPHDTAKLTAEITPEDTEMSQITWSSSDESVVAVKNGQVVAVAPGHAVITASTGFAGGVKAECEVEVKEPEYILTDDWEIINEDLAYWDLNDDGGVTIQTQIGEIYSGGKFTVKNLFLTPIAQQGDFTVNVKLDFAPEANYQTAGLILFQDVDNNFCVSRRYHTSFGGDILAYHGLNNAKWTENNSSSAVKITDEDQGPVSLQITKSGDVLTASYKWDGDSEWTQICQQTYTGLTGDLKVGLYVANAGNEDIQIPASFSDFTVQYAGEEPVQIAFSEKNPNAEPEEPEELSTAVLEYALELADKVSTENVMDAVAERFEAVKAEAQAVLDAAKAGDPSVTQKQIDDSWKALIDIMQHLSFEKVDKASLESVIRFAEEIEPNLDSYIETGKQEFTDALANARTVYEDELAMADEVEQAWTRLLKAAADLRLYADKDALEDLISEAEAIDLTAYTEESAQAFTAALASAKEVLADETLSEDDQSIVDEAAEALEAARGQLVAKADAEEPSGTTADPGQSGGSAGQNTADGQKTADKNAGKTAGAGSGSQTAASGSKAVKTGDSAAMAGYLLAAGAALAAGNMAYKRRRKRR